MVDSERSTIVTWGKYILGVALAVLVTLIVLGGWIAYGDPSNAALGAIVIAVLLGLNVFARRLGITK